MEPRGGAYGIDDTSVVRWEIARSLTDEGLAATASGLDGWLVPGGDVVAVHRTADGDHPRTGRDVARWLDGISWLDHQVDLTDPDVELGVWRRR